MMKVSGLVPAVTQCKAVCANIADYQEMTTWDIPMVFRKCGPSARQCGQPLLTCWKKTIWDSSRPKKERCRKLAFVSASVAALVMMYHLMGFLRRPTRLLRSRQRP